MSTSIRSLAFLALGLGMASVSKAAIGDSGTGTTTRYWDCCKGSCSWPGKADVSSPVKTCSKSDSPLSDPNAASGCDGGSAYMCSDQSPWAVSADLAYGFAAVSGDESSTCCSCYELTFTSTSIAGKKMIVQATNTGSDVGTGQFDLAIPGGGVGLFNACTDQYGAPPNGWGAQYGGISTDTCSTFPTQLQSGCSFRFGDFFEGADNPTVEWEQVTCPKAITDKTGCVRSGETPSGSDGVSVEPADNSGTKPAASSTKPAASSTKPAASNTKPASSYTKPATSIASPSSGEETPASSPAASVETMPSAVGSQPPSYGTTSAGSVSYSSAAASSSSAAGPVGGSTSDTGSYPQPTGGDEQCHIEYVYVDGGSI